MWRHAPCSFSGSGDACAISRPSAHADAVTLPAYFFLFESPALHGRIDLGAHLRGDKALEIVPSHDQQCHIIGDSEQRDHIGDQIYRRDDVQHQSHQQELDMGWGVTLGDKLLCKEKMLNNEAQGIYGDGDILTPRASVVASTFVDIQSRLQFY